MRLEAPPASTTPAGVLPSATERKGDACMSTNSESRVTLDTSKGRIVLELDGEKAPQTVDNFLSYVKSGHFDGTIFHRVIPNFMIQGGGFTESMSQKPTQASIQNEADNGLKNTRGSIAMARTSDPHSASAQFFINLKDNDFLNHTGKNAQGWGYTVFGQVVEGMDVVDQIARVKTGRRGVHDDVPMEAVTIQKATAE
jgi:peptidyl-prolyl cis-trans isomerase B (cyclophilin B)